MTIQPISDFSNRLKQMILVKGLTDKKVAINISVGICTIFIPFPTVQTPFVAGICFLFKLNFPLVYLINWINNHLTAAPICFFSTITGNYLLKLMPFKSNYHDIFTLKLSEFSIEQLPSFLIPFIAGSLFLMIIIPLITYFPVYSVVKSYKQKYGVIPQ